jgi:hypothetical protein
MRVKYPTRRRRAHSTLKSRLRLCCILFKHPCLGPPHQCEGERPPLAVATPTLLPQERGGSISMCGVCVSGRDDVRTFGAWWRLKMHKMLPQIAYSHQNPKTLEYRGVRYGYQQENIIK